MAKSERRVSGRFAGMVKFAAGVLVGASLSCVVASAAQPARHDGAFWNELGKRDKIAYLDGYSDAAQASLGRLDQLKVAAGLFHWKGANKILSQVGRGLNLSALSTNEAVAYLNNVYSNPRYGDFDLSNAIELAVINGPDGKPAKATPESGPNTPESNR